MTEREKKMRFNKSRFFVTAAFALTSLIAVSTANAQDSTCPYNLASLQGAYAVLINYGASVAIGMQAQVFDGRGNLSRTGVLNQPVAGSATGARTVGVVTSVGTYTVNCNGTGTITRIVTRPDGSKAGALDDFIITQAEKTAGGPAIALTIVDAQRDPSVILPGGVFVTRVHTRLPTYVTYNSN
jgi:hypothetical protein